MQNIKNGVYLISKPSGVDFDTLESLAATGMINLFQLRLKNISVKDIILQGVECKKILAKYSIPLIINDNYEIYKKLDADGLHLGQGDIKADITRDFNLQNELSQGKIVGFSCYNDLNLAISHAKQGASYVSFGAMFKTKTKQGTKSAPQDIILQYTQLAKALKLNCKVCAIGGITNRNVSRIIGYGLNYASVVSYINNASQPIKALKKIAAKFS